MSATPTYEERLEQVSKLLETKHAIALATSEHNRVTVRTVTFASRGIDIYFLSLRENTKLRQIATNRNVALCRDHIQIEGTAEILGAAALEENAEVAGIFRAKYGGDYERHINHPAMIAVRVRPTRISVFHMEDGRFLVDRLDIGGESLAVERLDEASPVG